MKRSYCRKTATDNYTDSNTGGSVHEEIRRSVRYSNIILIFPLILFLHVIGLSRGNVAFTKPDDMVLARRFTTDDGLPQNTATDLLQSSDGYIWISTYGGLARFDGLKFTVFTTANSSELISNRLLSLAEDANGTIWIGSEDGDLLRYDNGRISVELRNRGEPSDSTIADIHIDRSGLLWLATGRGLKTYDARSRRLVDIADEEVFKGQHRYPGNLIVNRIVEDGNGVLWISTNSGLVRYSDQRFTDFDLAANAIHIWPRSDGGVFIPHNNSIAAFDGSALSFPETIPSPGDFPEPDDDVSRDAFVSDGVLYDPVEGGLKTYSFGKFTSEVSDSQIRSILFDRSGNLWIGTQLCLLQPRKRHIKSYVYENESGPRSTAAVIETADGSIWVASGYSLLRFQSGLVNQPRIFDVFVISMAKDAQGNLWVGTDKQLLRFVNEEFVPVDTSGIIEGTEISVYFDPENTMWIGARGRGLTRYRDGVAQRLTVDEGLVDNTVLRVFTDSRGRVWIGTRNGLSLLQNGGFTNFSTRNGLSNNHIRDILEDKDGTIWVGTYGGGLLRYRDGAFTAITELEGLSENIVSRILQDDQDKFWILGNRGIFTVSRKALNNVADGNTARLYCTVYGTQDGMDVSEGNGIATPGGWRASDGRLWFPMIKGGIVIEPTYPLQTNIPVYIEKVRLNDRVAPLGQSLEIEPNEQNLEIEYTGIEFSTPEQVQFRYRLDGFDDEWREVGNRRVAYYPYLPPGKYTFKVGTAGGLTESTLEIVVHAPFWKTWTFFIICFVAVAASVVTAYQLRLMQLRRLQEVQAEFSRQLITAHETERKRIAAEIHDGIGHSIMIIKNWASLALKKSTRGTDIESDLNDIVSSASEALEETRRLSTQLRPLHLQRFGLTSALAYMIKVTNSSAPTNFKVDLENIDGLFDNDGELSIFRIVQEAVNNISRHSQAQNGCVTVRRMQRRVTIEIEDDGRGFDEGLQTTVSDSAVGFGLTSIRQRVGLLGGNIVIHSLPGRGTKIQLTLESKDDGQL